MVDNDVTVLMRLRDELTAPLKRVEAQVKATDEQIRRTGAGGSSHPLVALFDSLDGKTGNLDRQLSGLNRTLVSMSRSMQRDLLYGLGGVTAGLTAAAGAATYFGLKAVNSFQHTQAAFSVLTGSMQNGMQLYNQLMQLNLQSPFDMQPLAQAEQTLLGFGFNQTNSLAALRQIANVAAVQQDPNAALDRMALAVGQINQSGTVRGQDLNQLVQSGFPAYRLIPGGKQGMLGGGTMSSSDFIAQLSNPNNPALSMFGGASAAMNQSISGQLSNLTTEVRQSAITAFEPLGTELTKQMPQLTKVLQGEVEQLAPSLSKVGGDLITGIEHLLPVITPLLTAGLNGIDLLFRSAAPFLDELQQQDPAITAALGDFFATLAGEEPQLAALFGDLLQLLPPMIHALDDLIPLIDPLLRLFDGMLSLGPVRTIVADLLIGLLAYRTLEPAILAVMGMSKALFGLAAAEEAAAVAGSGAGAAGVAGRAGKVGKAGLGGRAIGALGGLSLLVPGLTDIHGRGLGSDLSTIGGAAMTGASVGGIYGAVGGAILGGAYDAGIHVGSAISGGGHGKTVSATERARETAWIDAMSNDPKLQGMLTPGSSIDIATGAIVIHGVSDPVEAAKQVRAELERYIAEKQARH